MVYLVSAGLEIGGILYTGRIGLKVVKRGNPPIATGVQYPEERQVRLAVGLVLAGVLVGLGGNWWSLYVK
jgi:hypothetical protein